MAAARATLSAIDRLHPAGLPSAVSPGRAAPTGRSCCRSGRCSSPASSPSPISACRACRAGRSSVLAYTTMLWIVPLSLLIGEKVGWRGIVGALLGVAGIVVLVDPLRFDWSDRGRRLRPLLAAAGGLHLGHRHSPCAAASLADCRRSTCCPGRWRGDGPALDLSRLLVEPAGLSRSQPARAVDRPCSIIGAFAGPIATWAAVSVGRACRRSPARLGHAGRALAGHRRRRSSCWASPITWPLAIGTALVIAGIAIVILDRSARLTVRDRRPAYADGTALARNEAMANKVYKDAKSALEGVLQRRHDADVRRLRPGRHSRQADPGDARCGRQEPHLRQQQCRHRRRGPRPAARDRPGQEDDLVLRRREQDLRQALPRGQARARVQSAGHAGRALPRRRRGHPRLLHQDRRRHAGRRGQGDQGLRRRGIRHGARPGRRPGAGQGVEGRHLRQSRLPQGGAKLQSDDGDGGQDLRRRGRGAGAGRASSIPTTSTRPAFSSIASSAARPTTSRSSSAPFARLEESQRWPGPATRWRHAPPRN